MATKNFSQFTHIEESVNAIRYSSETQSLALEVLGEQVAALLMSKFLAEQDLISGMFNVTFRYKTDTVEQTLTDGNYLVQLNAGQFVVMTEEDFTKSYTNTSVDPIIPVSKQRIFEDVMFEYFNSMSLGVTVSKDDYVTKETAAKIAEVLVPLWYVSNENTFYIKCHDAGVVDPTGLGKTMDYMKDFTPEGLNENTTFIISFNNGDYADMEEEEEHAEHQINLFNYIGMEKIIGELRLIDETIRKRITGIQFLSLKAGVQSPIAPSVTEEQWESFISQVQELTSATRSNIKR